MSDEMFRLVEDALDAALTAGAAYADARVVHRRARDVRAQNGDIESLGERESFGLGVRALVGSSWGFAATSDLSHDAVTTAGRQAHATAVASARVPGPAAELARVPVHQSHWETEVVEPPIEMGVTEQADLVVGLSTHLALADDIAIGRAELRFWDTWQWFASSQGHRISQHITESGGQMSAVAVGDDESQIRSFPQAFGQFRAGGFEVVRSFDLPAHVDRVAAEAAALLRAPVCPQGEMDLVLDGSQVAMQIHESVGHATELDRILGWEAAFAGTSFLDLSQLGSFRYGSDLMNITADATLPGAMGSFGYDDEGTPARAVDLVRDGIWVGVLSGRDSAHVAGIEPGGMVRGEDFNRLPMVRMTNVGLEPGDSSLAEMIADTERGIYMATNRSWSIDDQRRNFQFGCEIGWEIVDGELGRMVRNPTYTGITPTFWRSMDRLAGGDEWDVWGLPNCGKGQPVQVMHTAHHAAPARFRNVRVGVSG